MLYFSSARGRCARIECRLANDRRIYVPLVSKAEMCGGYVRGNAVRLHNIS